MNQTYNVELNNKHMLSLQTDPDLYALKNKKKPSKQDSLLVSTNRLAYVEALVGNYI